ncbi:uncharacterized protein METZ01_LOCUS372446, partial [marine metagenome]
MVNLTLRPLRSNRSDQNKYTPDLHYAIRSFQNRRLRRVYVLATKVYREEWRAIKELADK